MRGKLQLLKGIRGEIFISEVVHKSSQKYKIYKKRWSSFLLQSRLEIGLSVSDLERVIGLPPGFYASWENGFTLPSPYLLQKILKYFTFYAQIEAQFLFNQLFLEDDCLRDIPPVA